MIYKIFKQYASYAEVIFCVQYKQGNGSCMKSAISLSFDCGI